MLPSGTRIWVVAGATDMRRYADIHVMPNSGGARGLLARILTQELSITIGPFEV